MSETSRTLVTGALGCLGAWTLKALLELGDAPIAYDLGRDDARLRLILDERERAQVTMVAGDVTDLDAVGSALDEHAVTSVVHLAALQVPLCRAEPTRGAHVNVFGTTVMFEAVRARRARIPGLAYASSVGVYNASDPSPAPESGGAAPATLYGVYKLANEGTARAFWQDEEVASLGIRPYVVYGPGRDEGMSSGPSLAMAAAARGESYEIAFGGIAQYDFAPDVGRAFALASRTAMRGASVANFPGESSTMEEVVRAIESAAPAATGAVSWRADALPFPQAVQANRLENLLGPIPRTPLVEGVRQTIEHARRRG